MSSLRLTGLMGLLLLAVSAAHAEEEPKVIFEATLDAAHEVPAPTGTLPGAGATATLLYDETDKTLTYTIDVQGLTGPPGAAHIHQAPPGVAGPVKITFDQTKLGGGAPPLPVPAAVLDAMLAGGTYANVHTLMNPNGEIRGQIALKPGVCSCTGSASDLRRCVRQAIKGLDKSQRRADVVQELRRDTKKSSCGRTKGPKKAVACCVRQPAGNIVTGKLCLPVADKACTKRGGTSLGAGSSCFPSNPC